MYVHTNKLPLNPNDCTLDSYLHPDLYTSFLKGPVAIDYLVPSNIHHIQSTNF